MINNQIFAWENYEENPDKMIGVDTIPTQKDATYNEVSKGVFTGSMLESFFTNVDKATVPQVASVIGMEPGEIIYGSKEGMVMVNKTYDFTSYAEDQTTVYGTGKAKVLFADDNKTYIKVVENSVAGWTDRVFYVNSTEVTTDFMELIDASTNESLTPKVYVKIN